MDRALDRDQEVTVRGFDTRPFHFHVTTLGKLFTHVPLSASSIIWYLTLFDWEGNCGPCGK